MKTKANLEKTDNSREYKFLKRKVDLKCPLCPPHAGENITRTKHGTKKPKKKNKR